MNPFVRFTIYHEFDRRWKNSDRAEIIRSGWGTETPAAPTKHTKVQIVEMTDEEFALWTAAKKRSEANLWNFTFPAAGGAR